MTRQNVVVLGVAVFLGLIAVILVNAYFSGMEKRQEEIAEQAKMARVVVAAQDMAFGTQITSQNIKLVSWPEASVPDGAFRNAADMLKASRVALRPIQTGEPILASRVSGPDGRATLSANIPEGKLAFSIPITDSTGVGGFVRPGDVVDVLVTRQIPGEGAEDNDKMADVVIEAVPVLGVDQISDENKTDPAVAKTVTLEVDTVGAQKLALARELGVLSLGLRNVAWQGAGPRRTVIPRQLSATNLVIPAKAGAAAPASAAAQPRGPASSATPSVFTLPRISGPSMTVVRGVNSTQYEVRRGY